MNAFDRVGPWLDAELGAPFASAGADPIPVLTSAPRSTGSRPFWAVAAAGRALVTVREDWLDQVRAVVAGLSIEELFSVFGAYELTRVTLPHGTGIWGPTWYFVIDPDRFEHHTAPEVRRLDAAHLQAEVDFERFWHCFPEDAEVGFGVYSGSELQALATVKSWSASVVEIGVDVAVPHKRGGLGRAVVGAAAAWIIDEGKLPVATTAPWNVPSARTLRSLGMVHVFTDMGGVVGEFRVPPSPLGTPYAGAEIYHYYPDWAMNPDIRPKDA